MLHIQNLWQGKFINPVAKVFIEEQSDPYWESKALFTEMCL